MGIPKKLKFKELPDHKKLLWLVADKMTPNDVLYLAELDYGYGADKHAQHITHFKNTLETSQIEYWYPMEVWELNRWSSPGAFGTLGHARRAFSCAALMACYFEGVGEPIESLDTLLPLFESLALLDMPNWQEHLCAFLAYGVSKTKYPDDKFKVQFALFLATLERLTSDSELKTRFEQLRIDEMMAKTIHWERQWYATFEPQVERSDKFKGDYITHGTAHIFTARYVFQKAEQIDEAELSEDLKNLSRRIANLRKGSADGVLPGAIVSL